MSKDTAAASGASAAQVLADPKASDAVAGAARTLALAGSVFVLRSSIWSSIVSVTTKLPDSNSIGLLGATLGALGLPQLPVSGTLAVMPTPAPLPEAADNLA